MGNNASNQTCQVVTFSQTTDEYNFDVKNVEDLLSPHKTLLKIISLCGVQGSGKTLLYQLFIQYLECMGKCNGDPADVRNAFKKRLSEGLELKNSPQTRGICLQKKPFNQVSNQGEVSTFFIDTEGFSKESTQYYKDISMFCAAMSSNLLFNVNRSLKQTDLKHLQIFVDYGKKLKKAGFTTVLQKLCFVIHDWSGPTQGLTTLLEKYSTIDHNYTLLQIAFSKLECWFLPPLHKCNDDSGDSYGNKKVGALSDYFVDTFCAFAWDVLASNDVKQRNKQNISNEELCRIAQYCIKLINNHAIEGPKALLRESAMEYFRELVDTALEHFESKLIEIVRNVSISSEFKELFDAAKLEAFKEVKAFSKHYRCLSWYKAESFRAQGTCLGWRFQYKRQFDEKKEKLPAKVKKNPTKASQKQKIKSKKLKKEESFKAELKSIHDIYRVAYEAATAAHTECLEAGGSWLDEDQYIMIADTSEVSALKIYDECVPEYLRYDEQYHTLRKKVLEKIKTEATERWETIRESKGLWKEKLTEIAFEATDVYNDKVMKGTDSWISNETFRELKESARKCALHHFKTRAGEVGADEDMFDTFVKRVKDGFSLFDSELESRRMKNLEDLKGIFEKKVCDSFVVYKQQLQQMGDIQPHEDNYATFLTHHAHAMKYARDHFATNCTVELHKWPGYHTYESSLVEFIEKQLRTVMDECSQLTQETTNEEMYKMIISCKKIYEQNMETHSRYWQSMETLEEAHNEATRRAVDHFKQLSAVLFHRGSVQLDAYVSNVQYSCDLLFKDILEINIRHELKLDCAFEERVQNAIMVYTKLMKESKVDPNAEKAFSREHAAALKGAQKLFESSVVTEEKKWKGYKRYENKLLEYINNKRVKLWHLYKEETVDKTEVQKSLSDAVESYILSMKEAVKKDPLCFDEDHEMSCSKAKKLLVSSSAWQKAPKRSSLEQEFDVKIAKEKDVLQLLFELQKSKSEKTLHDKIVEKYKNQMRAGLGKSAAAHDFSTQHMVCVDEIKADCKLSLNEETKHVEGNKSLEFYRNSFEKIHNMSQKLVATTTMLENCDNLRRFNVKTLMPFYLPNDLLVCEGTRLDTGFFSFVKRAWNNAHGCVAVKYYNLTGNHVTDSQQMDLIMRGMEEFHLRTHDCVVKVLGYTAWKRSLGAVIEYANDIDYFNVKPHLPKQHLPPVVCARLCLDVASAYAFLLANPSLAIGDITPDDVFVTRALRCKVGGFKFRNVINGDVDAESQRERYCGRESLGAVLFALVVIECDADYDRDKLRVFASVWDDCPCSTALARQIESCFSRADVTAARVGRELRPLVDGRDNLLRLSQQTTEVLELLSGFREQSPPLSAYQISFDK